MNKLTIFFLVMMTIFLLAMKIASDSKPRLILPRYSKPPKHLIDGEAYYDTSKKTPGMKIDGKVYYMLEMIKEMENKA